ncbi:MAG TPA: sigma-70 family RNA polymerase sigma factor [Vicinamibacterales bacterium]|nr:sigma-70 family RNA polymerase sigma factor [Vicinamibacterales bacterium]
MATSPDEALLVLRAQFGDREALEALLRAVRPSLLRYVASVIGAEDAEDLIQDVLFLIYRKLGGLQNADVFKPWAFRIASRAAFRHLKRRKRLPALVGDETLEELPADMSLPQVDESALSTMLATLSPASHAVLVLHFREEMTLAEVAAVLEIPIGTVRSRLAYGLTTLRKQLTERRSEHVATTRAPG